jgi:hypothetical protein
VGDKPSERAPGGSPALSFLLAGAKAIILIVSLLAMFIVGWSVWQWYRPEHLFNAVNRFGLEQLYAARTGCRGSCLPDWHVSMLGEVFDPGEERVQIVRRLADAGYEVWYDEGDKIGYILRGAGTGALFACDSHFIVDLTFDPSDHLVAADSIGSGTCL